ncbi:MAG: alpha/beta hydrolase [Clostridia bacterium]|nr:alpha/beta hydrolase [Clostridia bacterium]
MNTIIYVHGMGGSADEAELFRDCFPGREVVGFDYLAETPMECVPEFRAAFAEYRERYGQVGVLANSIGAYYSMISLADVEIARAWFISPVVDMEKLILGMMENAGVSEEELRRRGRIDTVGGPPLRWDYLTFVREHPIKWEVPTAVLYGSEDLLTSRRTVETFAESHRVKLTVMEGGEHWFHTPEQMNYLFEWLKNDQDL